MEGDGLDIGDHKVGRDGGDGVEGDGLSIGDDENKGDGMPLLVHQTSQI